jgi:peptidase YpeB-like protein
MRKTVTSIISATALLGASSLAMASPGVPGDQSQAPSASQSQPNSGATATPNSRTGSQAAPYDNSGSGASTSGNATLKSGGTTGSGTSAQVTDQKQVKQQLEQQGYTNVQNVRKDRTGWTAKANKDGQQVTVNVDNSGQIKTR